MRTLIAILFVIAMLLFAVAWRVGKRSTNPDDYMSMLVPAGAGAIVLVIDLVLLVCFALWKLFS